MTERIGIKLYQLLGADVPLSLSEAETESYPYVTYGYTVNPTRTKDGIAKYSAQVIFDIVSDDFDEAQELSEQIQSTLEQSANDDEFSSTLQSADPTCEEGVWTIELNYLINQYK